MRILTDRLPWMVEDLSVDLIDGYLTEALNRYAPITVHAHRRMLQTLYRSAQRDGLVNSSTRSIRRVKFALPVPRAWTHDELRRLLSVAAEMPGATVKRPCQYRVLMTAWILVGYATGLRFGDLMSIRHSQIRGKKLALTLRKTGRMHVVVLDEAALESIGRLPVYSDLIFGGIITERQMIVIMRRLVKRAGLPGSSKWLRRSSATYAELAGMSASRHLGHLTPGLAAAHYVDPVLLADERHAVPSIARPESTAGH